MRCEMDVYYDIVTVSLFFLTKYFTTGAPATPLVPVLNLSSKIFSKKINLLKIILKNMIFFKCAETSKNRENLQTDFPGILTKTTICNKIEGLPTYWSYLVSIKKRLLFSESGLLVRDL